MTIQNKRGNNFVCVSCGRTISGTHQTLLNHQKSCKGRVEEK